MLAVHFAEAEVNCSRVRFQKVALEAGEVPLLGTYDQWAVFRGALSNAELALQSFKREREISLPFVRGLPPTVLTRRRCHQTLGSLTFQDMLNEFAFHDMGHMRQILELCRACVLSRHGGWRD